MGRGLGRGSRRPRGHLGRLARGRTPELGPGEGERSRGPSSERVLTGRQGKREAGTGRTWLVELAGTHTLPLRTPKGW